MTLDEGECLVRFRRRRNGTREDLSIYYLVLVALSLKVDVTKLKWMKQLEVSEMKNGGERREEKC